MILTCVYLNDIALDDREGLRDLAENRFGLVILGDKGYTGEGLFDDMRRKGICLMSLKRSNYKKNWFTQIRQRIFRFPRKSIFKKLYKIGIVNKI